MPGSKKRKKHTAENTGDASNGTNEASAPQNRGNTSGPVPKDSGNGIKNAATASLTARVLNEENEKKKRRKMMGLNDNIDSLYTKENKNGKKSGDFMTRGYTIPAAARR